MIMSNRMAKFVTFISNLQDTDGRFGGEIEHLQAAKKSLDDIVNFINSVDFYNEWRAISNRCYREIDAEIGKRKGL